MATFIWPLTPVSVVGVATEATLLQVEQNTSDTVTELQTVNTTLAGVASEATLAGVATEATLTSAAGSLSSIDTKLTAPLAVSGPLTDTQLRNSPIEVDVTASVLPTGAATEATLAGVATEATLATLGTETTLLAIDNSTANIQNILTDISVKTAGSLVPLFYDNLEITYVTSGPGTGEISTVVYYDGSTVVATLTFTYDGSDRLQTVARS